MAISGNCTSFSKSSSDLIGGAVIGAVFSDLQTAILEVLKTTANFKSIFQRLQTTIISIKPIFDDIEKFGAILNRPQGERDMFVDQMKEGKELIVKSSQVKRWNLYKRYVYSKKLTEFDESLLRFFQINMQATQSIYIRQIKLIVNTGAAD